jgi:uncharacterized protein YjbI with pentapeptide repeats
MTRNLFRRPVALCLLLVLGLLSFVGCGGGDAMPTPQKRPGDRCASNSECQQGLCLVHPGDTELRCAEPCTVQGEVCPSGGRCILFDPPEAQRLACSLPQRCTENAQCADNAVCIAEHCQCLPDFYGDPGASCSVCAPENARAGCTVRTVSLPEVKGQCRSLDGTTAAGSCTRVEDCPDPKRFGCFGFLPAVIADPPCSCADLRTMDLSGANPATLGDLTGAWYGAKTQWPQGFDPTTSKALGPKAKLEGIDLSGSSSAPQAVVGGEVLTPDKPFDGSTPPTFTGANALRHERVVSGSVRLKVGDAEFRDTLHGELEGPTGRGKVTYANGEVRLVEMRTPPASGTPVEVAYRYRIHGAPLRPVAVTETQATLALADTSSPMVPRTAVVRIPSEPLVPDRPADGALKAFTFLGTHALTMAPIAKGSVVIRVGDVTLKDDRGPLQTEEGGGSTGTIDYSTGALTLSMASAPGPGVAMAASYRAARQVTLQPDLPWDPKRTTITISRERALPLRGATPGSVVLKVGELTLTDSDKNGRLGSGGNSGTLDYETGEVALSLAAPPSKEATVTATFETEAAVTLVDRTEPGVLKGARGAQGTIDYGTGRVLVKLAARLHPNASALIDFERHAEKTLGTQPRLDGTVKTVEATLKPGRISPGTLRLSLGPEALKPDLPFNGLLKNFTFAGANALKSLPVVPGTLALEVGAKRFADDGKGVLIGAGLDSTKTSTVDYASGIVKLHLESAPPANTKASASYAKADSRRVTPNQPMDAHRRFFTVPWPAATPLPLPGTVGVRVSEGALPEKLVPEEAYDGTKLEFTYLLERKPLRLGSLALVVGGVPCTDAETPGRLRGPGVADSSVDAKAGIVKVTFTSPPAVGTQGTATYARELPKSAPEKLALVPATAFDGNKRTHSFAGLNTSGRAVAPASLRVMVGAVQLSPDQAYDGSLKAHRYSGANALRSPMVPGSVTVQVGRTRLREDPRAPGVLTADDGSTGTISHSTGGLSVQFSNAPSAGVASSVSYRTQVTGEPLRLDRASDGDTRLSFTGSRALKAVPVVPNTVTIAVQNTATVLTEVASGRLLAADGSEGTLDYDTGELQLRLAAPLASGAEIKASYQHEAAEALRGSADGSLNGNAGSTGKVNSALGTLEINFAQAPGPGTSVSATFERGAILEPNPPFNGSAKQHRFQWSSGPVANRIVALRIFGGTMQAPITLTEQTPGVLTGLGATATVDRALGEVVVRLDQAAPAEAVASADFQSAAEVVLTDALTPGELRADDGSTGRVDAEGNISLSLLTPPWPDAQVKLEQQLPAQTLLIDRDGKLVGNGGSGTVKLDTGVLAVAFSSPPPAGSVLTAAYSEARVGRVRLDGIELNEAKLARADLSYTSLRFAKLARADLSEADLTGADLTGADLRGASLRGAKLKDANVLDANLAGADLNAADLTGTTGLDPERAQFPEWYVAGTPTACTPSAPDCVVGKYSPKHLVDALLEGTIDPRGGGLAGALLAGADLSVLKDLTGANLRGANLRGANLRGLKLSGADLSDALLEGAILTEVQAPDTVCPATGLACYDGGRSCASGPKSCVPKPEAALKLTRAALTGASFDKALITGADLRATAMARVDLSKTDASRAKLTADAESKSGPVRLAGARLRGTVFAQADLTGAVMTGVETSSDTRFTGAKLGGAELDGAQLVGAGFTGADLSQASLVGADLRGASLDAAKLEKTDLTRIIADAYTHAEGALFTGANLTEACLTNATLLRGAKLTQVIAPRASLAGAQLQGTDFTTVDLSGATLASGSVNPQDRCHCTPEGGPVLCGFTAVQGAVFKTANLSAADLSYTDMRGVNLEGVDLRSATLDHTDLRSAILINAMLPGSDLHTALLSGANLSRANLAGANLSGNELIAPLLLGADLTRTDLRRTVLLNANLSGAVLDQTVTDAATVMRGANLDLSAIRGCLRADLSDATLKSASLLQAGFITPSGKSYDGTSDFNCRMNFEEALLPSSPSTVCGADKPFPTPNNWLEAGRAVNGVYTQARLVGRLSSVRTQLDCSYLTGADLRGRDLTGANLRGAMLERVRLGRDDQGRQANLSNASLQGARLAGAVLEWLNVRNANFSNANLVGTSLKHADLRGANLSQVVLDNTQFELAKYSCAGQSGPGCTVFPDYPTFRWRQLKMIGPQSDLSSQDLSGYPGLTNPPVDLSGANLKDAKFDWTDLSGVSFAGANLESAGFPHANVSGVNFSGTNLKSSNFSNAMLNGSTAFSGSNIMEANFVASSGTPQVGGSFCNAETSFNSANPAYVLLLKISIEGSFPLYFPVITLELVPGWNVAGQCCFPVQGGIRLGC